MVGGLGPGSPCPLPPKSGPALDVEKIVTALRPSLVLSTVDRRPLFVYYPRRHCSQCVGMIISRICETVCLCVCVCACVSAL